MPPKVPEQKRKASVPQEISSSESESSPDPTTAIPGFVGGNSLASLYVYHLLSSLLDCFRILSRDAVADYC